MNEPVNIRPINDDDLSGVYAFIKDNFLVNVSLRDWLSLFTIPWTKIKPNNGFMLMHKGTIVGVLCCFYKATGKDEPNYSCNLSTWLVLKNYRSQSLRLFMSVVQQSNCSFSTLSVDKALIGLHRRLGFTDIVTSITLLLNVPSISLGRKRLRLSTLPFHGATLPTDLETIRKDHLDLKHLKHLVGEEICSLRPFLILYSRKLIRGIWSTNILYMSDPLIYWKHKREINAYFLWNERTLLTKVHNILLNKSTLFSKLFRKDVYLFFRGPKRPLDQNVFLYSEHILLDL